MLGAQVDILLVLTNECVYIYNVLRYIHVMGIIIIPNG